MNIKIEELNLKTVDKETKLKVVCGPRVSVSVSVWVSALCPCRVSAGPVPDSGGTGRRLGGSTATLGGGGGAARPRPELAPADYELFLQAFEKPTQIYRFLRTRNLLSPIFLNRTLSYMKNRMSRSHKSRDGFKVNSLLEKYLLKNKNDAPPYCMGSYMTLTFLGFYDKNLDEAEDYQVKVETLLLKICHKKRKDSSSAIVEVSVGSSSVPLNPSASEPPQMASAVSISSEAFSPSQGPNVKSYMLLLRVTVQKPLNFASKNNEIRNGECDEPAHKRLKSSEDSRLLGSELIVYDKHNRCLLSGGEYDLVLHDVPPNVPIIRSPHKALAAHWESITDDTKLPNDHNPFDIFNIKPTLKLKLSWSQEPCSGMVTRPRPFQQLIDKNDDSKTDSNNSNKENNRPLSDSKMNNLLNKYNGNNISGNVIERKNSTDTKVDNSNCLQIIYQFLYNNNSRQQTEACEDLHCPWCSLDCGRLYALLKHLKLCHSRFSFTYFPIPRGARIDVSINELYDGSYAGSPHEVCGVISGVTNGPVRRTPLTHILVCRPLSRRPQRLPAPNNLAEFLESDDNELTDGQRPYITGHNRLYHHTITCLPVYPKELHIDSEEETDPLWLQQKTMMMIDEFTDVNEGEKELMKMWNLHVMKYNFVGDCQIPIACQMFLQLKGKELLEKNLYRNFVLHMSSLHDFGLITSIVLYQTIQILIQMLAENNVAKQKMKENIMVQRENWKAIGMHQQPTIIDQKSAQISTKSSFNGESSPAVRRKTGMQNASRLGSSNYTVQSSLASNSNENKRKLEIATNSGSNGSFEIPQRRKSTLITNGKSSAVANGAQTPLRRKSAGNNPLGMNVNRKRLSLQERKNST